MLNARILLIALVLATVSGCTEFGDTTEVSTATGGVLGAGLGVIVGNQTGDPTTGLVVGALAGSGAGAMVGSSLEDQERSIRTNDEAIERQERTLSVQKSELDDLRRLGQDSVSFKGSARPGSGQIRNEAIARNSAAKTAPGGMLGSRAGISESTLVEPQEYQGALDTRTQSSGTGRAMLNVEKLGSQECQQAANEAAQAKTVSDSADKLFHLRRALRYCPEHPNFHSQLGELYLSLGRSQDAQFEFQEALRLDPQNEVALNSLGKITK